MRAPDGSSISCPSPIKTANELKNHARKFWSWHNVDHDMKDAIDLRDTDGRDPALCAAEI